MMLIRQWTLALLVSSGFVVMSSPARADSDAHFRELTRKLNEAERLRPICIRVAELGVTEPTLTEACNRYFGGADQLADKTKVQLAQTALRAASGFAQAEKKAEEAAEKLAVGEVAAGKEKLDEATALAEETAEETQAVASAPDHGQQSLADDDDGKHRYGGIEFGIGIGFTYDLGNNDRIGDDVILVGDDRIVRAQTEGNLLARFMLETHYFFTPCTWRIFNVRNNCRYEADGSGLLRYVSDGEQNFGIGPFVALQPGSQSLIDGVGAGLMIGMRRPASNTTDSFNLGVGVFYDLRTKVLGEGIVLNEPLPVDETYIRFRTTSQCGLLILSSYSF